MEEDGARVHVVDGCGVDGVVAAVDALDEGAAYRLRGERLRTRRRTKHR